MADLCVYNSTFSQTPEKAHSGGEIDFITPFVFTFIPVMIIVTALSWNSSIFFLINCIQSGQFRDNSRVEAFCLMSYAVLSSYSLYFYAVLLFYLYQ